LTLYNLKLPKKINSTYECITLLNFQFVSIITKVNGFDEIRFDFTNLKWIDAEMTVVLAMMIEISLLTCDSVTVEIDNLDDNVKTILRKNNFFPLYGIDSALFDTYDTTINFFAENPSKDRLIYEYIHEEVFKSIGGSISDNFLKEVSYCIFELVHNIIDHSDSDRVYICGQSYPKKGFLRLAISDKGVGIPALIKQRNPHIQKDTEAVEWALGEGNTTKIGREGGIGLYSIRDKLLNRGSLKVISNQAFYQINSNGSIIEKTLSERFRGTLIILEFDINKCLKTRDSNKVFTDEILGF
jgi:ATP-binding region, ATPase family protein